MLDILFVTFSLLAPKYQLFGFPIFWSWAYLMKVIPEPRYAQW
jgi:hypothetical protein